MERHGPQPDENDAVQRLRRLDSCAASDALDRLKLNGVVAGVPRQSGEGRIAGRVVTVKLGVGQAPEGAPRHLGTAAVELAGPDDVIVIEQHAHGEAACWGGLLSLGASVRGVAGVISDGPVRDIDEARALRFPVFARSLTAKTARGRIVELGTNVPISFEGVAVNPGDYAIADSSAVVFIAAAEIGRVLDAAEAIAAKEDAMAKAVRAGEPIAMVMGGLYEHMLKD
jgi:4-hydroxy-4-methyl-2-oxoglutarate aldolase